MLEEYESRHRLLRFTSLRHDDECLILIRGKYYKAIAISCNVCGLDFHLLEDVPFTLDVDDGWDTSVIMGSYYANLIEENPTVIIQHGENDISFWRSKDA